MVADVGCGHGESTILLAQAFPRSRFFGFDTHARSVERARRAAGEAGVAERVVFEIADAAAFPGSGYDLVAYFDAFHDLGVPVAAAYRAQSASHPTGRSCWSAAAGERSRTTSTRWAACLRAGRCSSACRTHWQPARRRWATWAPRGSSASRRPRPGSHGSAARRRPPSTASSRPVGRERGLGKPPYASVVGLDSRTIASGCEGSFPHLSKRT